MKTQKIKIVCYGVRESEKPFFLSSNKNYNYDLILIKDLLNDENIKECETADAILVRANCNLDVKRLDILKTFPIKYILTRTVGVNHIDIDYAKKLGFKLARVPSYSPNAVSELAISLALGLLRNTFYMTSRTGKKNFIIDDNMFAKEIRKSTIGIIGTGRIGIEVAKVFKALGAKVLGFDIFENKSNESILEYRPLNDVLAESDLISLHLPYIPNENKNMFNEKLFNQMKKGSFLVNCARGELIDLPALIKAVETKQIRGAALDTLGNEQQIFFKDFTNEPMSNEIFEKLVSLYPQIVLTCHVGSFTDEAITNMVDISFDNLDKLSKEISTTTSI